MAWTWEQEKAYCQRRAKELYEKLDEAIANCDLEAFSKTYQTAMRYAPKRELGSYYARFLRAMNERG